MTISPPTGRALAEERTQGTGVAAVVVLGVVGAAIAASWWSHSSPAQSFSTVMVSWSLLLVAALTWLTMLAVAMVRKARPLVLVVTPVLVAVMAVANYFHLPLSARFEASRVAFNNTVAVAATPSAPTEDADNEAPFPTNCPNQIGTYAIERCATNLGGYLFYDRADAFMGWSGFAYLPFGPPNLPSEGADDLWYFTDLGGDWFAFYTTFD